MIDDYQYKSTPLTPKNEGLFGFGGKPGEGSRGFSSTIVDAGPGSGSSGNIGLQGIQGIQGIEGQQGPPGPLIDGQFGDMLYHNGVSWVTLPGANDRSILRMQLGTPPQWRPAPIGAGIVYQTDTDDLEALAGFTYGDMLFWDTNNWSIIPAAAGDGISVLASSGGTPYWIQTESCDAPPE
jgi:hypothetical protein